MSKFTPGPWRTVIGKPDSNGWIVANAGANDEGKTVYIMSGPMYGDFLGNAEGDGNLIAAAPELYWALKNMLVHCIWDTAYADRAKAALAKADGQA